MFMFTRAHNTALHFQYEKNGVPLQHVEQVHDLGVCINSKLKFRYYIRNIFKKTYSNLVFVLSQTPGFTHITILKSLYDATLWSRVIWSVVRSYVLHMKINVWISWNVSEINSQGMYVYMTLYGMNPHYPLLYPRLLVLEW